MKQVLKRYAGRATKAKPTQAAPTIPTAAPAARHWALPDPGACAALKSVEPSKPKPEALDRRIVAALAKITQQLN